jgi:predicted dehydrogenase
MDQGDTIKSSVTNLNETIQLAVIGAGSWVKNIHLPVIEELQRTHNVVVRGIWNRTREKAESLQKSFNIDRVYNTLDELIQDRDIDGICVVVSKEITFSIIEQIRKKKIPILCEKPPGKTGEEAETLAHTVTVPNIVAFNRRYAPLVNTCKRKIDDLETLHYVECGFYRRQRNDKHFITETGIHAINLFEYLFGPISDINVVCSHPWDRIIPNKVVELAFESGLKGMIKFFPFAGISAEWYEIYAENQHIHMSLAQPFTDTQGSELRIYSNTTTNCFESEKILYDPKHSEFKKAGFIDEYEEFIDIISSRKNKPLSSFQNSYHSMLVCEKIEQS